MKIENKTSNRNFGIFFFIIFLIVALWPLLNSNEIRLWSLVISLVFFVLGILNSKLLNPLNNIWFKFGLFLGNFFAPIIMGLIFFFVVTPTGILMKLFGKDLINLKKNNKKTYWITKKDEISSMKNQF
jgi:hypothetical protein